MGTLILLRGLPGSGKSTYAKYLADAYTKITGIHCLWTEADHRMHDDEGNYYFDPALLDFVHKECFKDAERAIMTGVPYVLVSNTFTQLWEITPYIELANAYKYNKRIFHMTSQYKDVHNVPEHILKRMAARWEPYPDEETIITSPKPGDTFVWNH